MTSSEKHNRDDGGSARTAPALPAVRNSAFAKHWLGVDEGGTELTKAVFGAQTRRAPPRPAPDKAAQPLPASTPVSSSVPVPSRLRASVALLLLVLTVLLATPAARLLGFAPRPERAGTVEVSPHGKPTPMKPSVRPEAKRAGEA
ncbi:MAG: hypothetical protein GY873_27760 [Bosea sp.]|uniref:hypothetical protein n=1 Tax=Bosea sp. (in: a-proteobacteria) TaxID=1871050 RepID=UPI0023A3054C|nr:hypothetical protein [Bosea sp. (in: a-proteobacteria)]MCP4737994.1 hypothetical protein [Bosea sp. (in: a-proteobacteria)]